MNLLVCISKTPDTTSKIAFDASGKKLLEDGVQFILNPYDEWYALVRAIELKEQFGALSAPPPMYRAPIQVNPPGATM